MLPAAYHWIDSPDGSFLQYRFGNVATVTPSCDRWRTRIRWRGLELCGRAGSREQGKRFVAAWVAHQRGFPSARARMSYVPKPVIDMRMFDRAPPPVLSLAELLGRQAGRRVHIEVAQRRFR